MKLDLIPRIADISAAEFSSTQLVAAGLFIVPRDFEYCLSIREHKARAK
jgi:hypothetical protein